MNVLAAPRHSNFRSWLYRIRPSVHHTPFEKFPQPWITHNWDDQHPNPNQVGNLGTVF
jgi:homogentisate 1,2-dioxygenase